MVQNSYQIHEDEIKATQEGEQSDYRESSGSIRRSHGVSVPKEWTRISQEKRLVTPLKFSGEKLFNVRPLLPKPGHRIFLV